MHNSAAEIQFCLNTTGPPTREAESPDIPRPAKGRIPRVTEVLALAIQFQDMIQRTERVTLRLGRLEGPPGKVYEKGVDILVALELLRGAYRDEYDVAIVVAGDGDYADVAAEVRATGKKVINAFFSESKSYELSKSSDGFVDLNHVNWQGLRLRRER